MSNVSNSWQITRWTVALLVAGGSMASLAAVERIEQGNLVIEGVPPIPEVLRGRLPQYQNTRSASFSDWHPSGQGILVSTRFGETSQVHWVKEPGGARRQLTFFDEPLAGASVSPDPSVDGFLFGKDVGGGEFFQLFFFDLGTSSHRLLTDGKSRNTGPRWAHDGHRFAFTTTRRNGSDHDIHVADIRRPGESVAVLEKGGAWRIADWSPDDAKLLVGRYVSANESYPYILDLASGTLTELDPSEEKVAYGAARFRPDGKGIYFVCDRGSEFMTLRYRDLTTGETVELTGDMPWNVEGLDLSRDGGRLAFTVNEEGFSSLHVWSLPDHHEAALPALPVGLVFGLEFAADGKRLGFTLNTPQTPGDAFSIDLASGTLARWTYSEVGGLDTESMVTPELIRYPTFDQVGGTPRSIPAFYYRPAGDGPFPVLIDIHGGPEAQERPGFDPQVQFAVHELGVAVLAPNVRGSAGYGKSYLLLDNGELREDSVKDIGALLDWIATRSELDANRVAVTGGSYGGYMVLAAMTHYNDRLRAAIDIVGISNFVTFLENTEDYRRDLRRAEYGDERDPAMRELLQRISPTTNVGKITKPLFVVQGLNDPRVPASEAEQIVTAVRANGGEVWYLLAKDEGHGFRKKSNRDFYSAAAALFLQEHLLATETGSAGPQ